MTPLILIAGFAALAWTSLAQELQLEWEQCGGLYYTGPTGCANSVCTYVNLYYSMNHSPLNCVERNLSKINYANVFRGQQRPRYQRRMDA